MAEFVPSDFKVPLVRSRSHWIRGQTPGRVCSCRRARHARARLTSSRSPNASRQRRLAHERAESEAGEAEHGRNLGVAQTAPRLPRMRCVSSDVRAATCHICGINMVWLV